MFSKYLFVYAGRNPRALSEYTKNIYQYTKLMSKVLSLLLPCKEAKKRFFLHVTGQLIWQRVWRWMHSRKPGRTFAGKTKNKREKFYSKKRGFQTICIQIGSWVQGRRKKPLTQLLYWSASLPEIFTFVFQNIGTSAYYTCLAALLLCIPVCFLTSCCFILPGALLLPWLWSGFYFLYLNGSWAIAAWDLIIKMGFLPLFCQGGGKWLCSPGFKRLIVTFQI